MAKKVADYGIVTDGHITLGSSAPNDFQEVKFNLDEPDPGSRSILMFRVLLVGVDNFKYQVKINGKEVFDAGHSNSGFFTIHEVLEAGLVKATDNVIQFKALTHNSGSINIADIVILTQHVL